MKAHFEFDPAKVSRINVKYHNGKWYVNLTSEIQEAGAVEIVNEVGINVLCHLLYQRNLDFPGYFMDQASNLS